MYKSERHHYIPEFYIKGFTDSEGFLFVYDKKEDEIKNKKVSPKSIFYEWDRNSINLEGIKSSVIEDEGYKRIDSECARIIRTWRTAPNTEELHSIYNYIGFQFFILNLFWRIPKVDISFQDYYDRLEMFFTDPETGNQVRDAQKEQNIKRDGIHKKLIRLKMPGVVMEEATKSKKSMKLFSKLFEFSQNLFLLGDYPIVFEQDPNTLDDLFDSILFFPISSNRIYSISTASDLNFDFIKATDFNAILIDQSERYVCSPDKSFLEKCVKYYRIMKSKFSMSDIKKCLFT